MLCKDSAGPQVLGGMNGAERSKNSQDRSGKSAEVKDGRGPDQIGVGAHWMGGVRLEVSRFSSGIGWISEMEPRRKEAPCGWPARGWGFCPLIFSYFNGRAELLTEQSEVGRNGWEVREEAGRRFLSRAF